MLRCNVIGYGLLGKIAPGYSNVARCRWTGSSREIRESAWGTEESSVAPG